jgi:hypothetical protein
VTGGTDTEMVLVENKVVVITGCAGVNVQIELLSVSVVVVTTVAVRVVVAELVVVFDGGGEGH